MFDPLLADIRFGCGRSPRIAPPADAEAMLAGLTAPDRMAEAHPVEPFEIFLATRSAPAAALGILRRTTPDATLADTANAQLLDIVRDGHRARTLWLAAHVARRVDSDTPLRERLESFWADHFTARGKASVMQVATSPYVESAIRPNIAGRFEDLLIAAVTNPLMLQYLDQQMSAGPNSPWAKRASSGRGLNENLAREVLELHTVGVAGPYSQADVRQLAELLTGLTFTHWRGTQFQHAIAEPGAETVLGRRYGGPGKAALADIHAVLRDLARHPATARHIAAKLAVHFTADTPDPDLVRATERAWLDTGGDLSAVYRAMLTHPAAWNPRPGNAKQPLDLIASACRALDIPATALAENAERCLQEPLRLMGQPWQEPPGPDGFPEEDTAWITPQGMAARVQWAFAMPQILRRDLPDPREFVLTALGPRARDEVRFAAAAAETRSDGIGVVLASPAFQRV